MSRTNHYRICDRCALDTPCWLHGKSHHMTEREITGRRNWVRKSRWPQWSAKSHLNGPPRWWWQEQHAKVRQIHRQLTMKSDDPVLPDEKDLIDLWGWY